MIPYAINRQISQMTYQPKSVAGKMAEFETLTLCISLKSSQMCTYFCKNLIKGYCLYLAKKLDSQASSVFKLVSLPTSCCYGFDAK